MLSHRRTFLSLRRHFLSTLNSNPPFPRSTPAFSRHSNPNSPSFSFSSSALSSRYDRCYIGLKCLIDCNSTPLTPNWSNFVGVRSFGTRLGEANKPPKETIMLAGCDWEHWLVIVDEPDPKLTRDEIIDIYIKTLAHVVGSEEEARMKIYSVSTRHYFAFGVLLQEEVAYKLKDLPHVRWVLPDSYLDVKNKTYAGEPFIDGQAVPYDPKYHEIWVRNREASLKSNARNKNKRREPDSLGRGPRPSSFASLPSTPSENSMPTDVSKNQSPPMSGVQSQNPEHASLSVPSISHQNERSSDHRLNQTAQNSLLPNRAPSALLPNQSQMQNKSSWAQSPHEPSVSQQNEIPSAHSVNRTQQISQSPNRATSFPSRNQASQYPQMQNRSSGWTRSSYEPAVSWENEMPSAHPVNQTPRTSQSPNRAPSSFSHSQASQYSQMQNRSSEWTYSSREPVSRENEWPSVHPVNQTPQTSQLPNHSSSSLSHNQASQYSQMQNQNRSSGWTYSPHEPSPTMHPHHQSWEDQNQNWTPRVVYENQAEGSSQMQNPSSQVFAENHVPQYSQMYTPSSPWTPAPPKPYNTMDMSPPHWSPVHPPQPSPTRDSNYQSWGNQYQYQYQGGHPGEPAFSQSHTPEYSQMQNQSMQRAPQPPPQPSVVIDESHHNWNNRNWNTGVGPQSQVGVGHPYQMQEAPTPGFSQNRAPQYFQIQNHSSPGNPSQPLGPSAWANPNHQSRSSQNQNLKYHNQSQSWEPASNHQSRPLRPHDSPPNFSHDYSYRDTSQGVQTGGSQYGHPSNTFQHQAFQGVQSSNDVESPQGWNHQNMMTSATQNNRFRSTNMEPPPQVHNHQFESPDKSRSMQNDDFRYKMGDHNQQVDYSGTMPSHSNMGDKMQAREYQERDIPTDEECMYGRR